MSMTELKERPKRWFCHYYDNGQSVWSEKGGSRIAREAAALKMPDGSNCFDKILTLRKKDLGDEWCAQRAAHFKNPRGAGLWVWKPRAVQIALEQMAPNDILLYADTGCEFKGSVHPWFKFLDTQDIVPFEMDIHLEEHWTKGDVFQALDARQFAKTKQRLGGIHLWRKGPLAQIVVQEWQKYCDNLQLIGSIDKWPSKTPNYPGFQDHRHDQSGFSIITKKFKIPAQPDSTWPPTSAPVLAASRRKD
jgi:hypothetical protein